ncbi:cobalamin B12-binding domain-containing protein [Brevibacillus choshinensis]|uniref:cobalamin B12-binding domain-containing protein n=1 Tax=Brevibacillus choshinensis TaxID=54911 RepID=UPI002E23802E|nr:cobalamin-dependent protein [Brevibacillus choshinensis]MED4582644.1 cobalamin-dependent protein [Brevibacillus choshinensis]MED4750666.1 cobalamin-dependent protein [Brevibacillus choshinensis]MED4779766.1 cobalamin-dependent protein [Brevibacillus choshinensis]
MKQRKIRVVMAKMGLDSHYRGAVMVSRYLVERGMDVIYIGNQLPDAIADTVVQEDAQVLGLSSLSGNHLMMVPRILQRLKEKGLQDIIVILGGVVPNEEQEQLLNAGVSRIFGTGSNLTDIADFIEEQVHL